MPTKTPETLGCADVIWKLTDLYPSADSSQLLNDLAWCRREAEAINDEYAARVAELEAPALATLINRLEVLESRITRLATYSFLSFCTDHSDAAAGALEQQVRELAAACGTQTVFFSLEWNAMEEARCTSLMAEECLAKRRHYLSSLRRYRPHQLSEPEEKLLLELAPAGREAWVGLFDKLMAGLKFGAGQRTEEEVLSDLYNPDRTIRMSAAQEMTAGLKDNLHLLTHIFNTLAADKMVSDRLRSFETWVSSMNLSNDLADATIEVLIESVTARYDLVHRYYRLKGRLLGLDRLEHFDRYAPLPALPTRTISWEECRRTVLDSFAEFSPQMAEIARQFFDRKWIHAPVQHGKQGGAFAHPCVPEAHPYVMVNYSGTLNDVSTVAHELGHGVHQVLAGRQGLFDSDTPLPLAETASVFAEMLVFARQLELLESTEEQRAFICQKLESIFATVFRQTAMNRFEEAMHNGRRQDGELSSEQLSALWLKTQQAMFADAVHLGDDYAGWWAYIPHFLASPGYVYSYAFGELLVLALYGLYQEQGESFVERYLDLLAAGGSQSPADLLHPFGIDLDSPAFWQRGLAVIEEMLERVE